MVDIPASSKLPVEHLAAGFNNVTNSYKFFWALAILEHIQDHRSRLMSLNDLLARMVAHVWYPTNYFRLSFGKQDRLSEIALQLGTEGNLPIDARKQTIVDAALAHLTRNTTIGREVKSLGRFVPYRFLRPFFSQQLRGVQDWKVNGLIAELAGHAFDNPNKPSLYRFIPQPENSIEIHPDWFAYLSRHLQIVRGFCLWHLVGYVQRNNPNVPNIARKLFEPAQRNLTRARAFWNLVYEHTGPLQCIYSGQLVQKQDISLDHFLPWRFVAHDLLWNIVPVPKNVNSAKGDCLPDLAAYLDPFARLQYEAVRIMVGRKKVKLLEDYTLLCKADSVEAVESLSFEAFWQILHDTIVPQYQIARNIGFVAGWKYAEK